MVKAMLAMALDGKGIAEEAGPRATMEEDGKWTVISSGMNFVNIYQVTEFDEAGLRWLVEHAGESAG